MLIGTPSACRPLLQFVEIGLDAQAKMLDCRGAPARRASRPGLSGMMSIRFAPHRTLGKQARILSKMRSNR